MYSPSSGGWDAFMVTRQLLPSGAVSPCVLLGFVQHAAEEAVVWGGAPEVVRLRHFWPWDWRQRCHKGSRMAAVCRA